MIATALSALIAAPAAYAGTYPIVDSYAGEKFFGDVFWAAKDNSSVFSVNEAGRVILKVDNESFVPYNEKRFAPKLESKHAYQFDTVFVMDAVKVPYGCGVWPAFWTAALGTWPDGGEIDIFEGVNRQETNQYAVHTAGEGCYADFSVQMLGEPGVDNCSIGANYGAGCTVKDRNQNSYGPAFAQAGGGAYIMEFTKEFIKIWFKTRSEVPQSMTTDAKEINTDELGEPTAFYPNTRCNIERFFKPQSVIIDITMCGVWAGVKSTLQQTCPPLGERGFDLDVPLDKRVLSANSTEESCYLKYVINDQKDHLKDAYFELNYINIFSKAGVIGGDSDDKKDSKENENKDNNGNKDNKDGESKTSSASSPGTTGSGGEIIGASNSGASQTGPVAVAAGVLGAAVALLL
ncbi:hypothetical protein A1Q2_02917 [Trichosporon asahii var. asahii CBS 8904]|uniref:GH16 domain-containing protein n=1 Tax=Trichosporon asahii var. asahii (strain CBS 8904) TaxID=1220162 RepID=K1VSZ7_TRIAC|nr:hypothetical protein A1Q2_02917 [Trichosporon asahii var. asahii CBS 8904]